MQSNSDILSPQDSIEVNLGNTRFYISGESEIFDDEFVSTSESKGVQFSSENPFSSDEINWPNWAFRAVEINGESLILHSNGDARHKGYLHNSSNIHNKHIRIWIQAKRVSTGADVFEFGTFFTDRKNHIGTPFDVNRFEQRIKDNWKDIESGNMSFTPYIWVSDYRD
jgi:hypothetical protein